MSSLVNKGDFIFVEERGPNNALLYKLVEVLEQDADFIKVQTTPYYRDGQYNPPPMKKHSPEEFPVYYLKTYLVPRLNIARLIPYSQTLEVAEREIIKAGRPRKSSH